MMRDSEGFSLEDEFNVSGGATVADEVAREEDEEAREEDENADDVAARKTQ